MRKTLRRVNRSLAEHGLKTTILKLYALVVDYYYDFKYGIDTEKQVKLNDLKIESNNKERGRTYQATRVIHLRKLFSHINSMLPMDGVFVDIGCGKGRVLLEAASFGFKEVRGVDFSHELCEIAKNNCNIYRDRTGIKTVIQIIKSDATKYTINADENVFFIADPFDDVVLSEIINRIAASLDTKHRKILIIYNNPICAYVIERHEKFAKLEECVFYGRKFTLYSNTFNSTSLPRC